MDVKEKAQKALQEVDASQVEEFASDGYKHFIITTTDKLAHVKDYIKRNVYKIEADERIKREKNGL